MKTELSAEKLSQILNGLIDRVWGLRDQREREERGRGGEA